MRLTYLSLTILFVASGIDEIFAQFKVIKMDSVRSLTSHGDEQRDATLHGKGKLLRDSNVTVIQVLPSERMNRRTNKVIRRRVEQLPSDLEVLTLTPLSRRLDSSSSSSSDGKLMKLHIINVRTGKIQDAIMLTTLNNNNNNNNVNISPLKPKSLHRTLETSRRNEIGSKEIIRVQPLHSNKPETTWNEININKRYPLKPYKLRNKFTSSKCKCEDTSRMWNCKKIQISIAQCKSNQFMCCSSTTSTQS